MAELLAFLQGHPQRIWCVECRGWGMAVMWIFWALILILIAYLVWFFFRILGGHGNRRWPWGGRGSGPGNGSTDDNTGTSTRYDSGSDPDRTEDQGDDGSATPRD